MCVCVYMGMVFLRTFTTLGSFVRGVSKGLGLDVNCVSHRAVCNTCSRDRLFLPGSSTAQRVCFECADGSPCVKSSATSRLTATSNSNNNACRFGSSSSSNNNNNNQTCQKLSVDDFDLLKVVGKGAFGKVMLVSRKDNRHAIFAMKVG